MISIKQLQFLALLCLFSLSVFAQQTVDNTTALRTAPFKMTPLLPGVCTVGDFLFDTSTTPAILKQCAAGNIWAAAGGGSPPSGGAVGGASGVNTAGKPDCTVSAGMIGDCPSGFFPTGTAAAGNIAIATSATAAKWLTAPYIDVRSWANVFCDGGVHDDFTGIQAGITALGAAGGTLFLPNCYLGSAITWPTLSEWLVLRIYNTLTTVPQVVTTPNVAWLGIDGGGRQANYQYGQVANIYPVSLSATSPLITQQASTAYYSHLRIDAPNAPGLYCDGVTGPVVAGIVLDNVGINAQTTSASIPLSINSCFEVRIGGGSAFNANASGSYAASVLITGTTQAANEIYFDDVNISGYGIQMNAGSVNGIYTIGFNKIQYENGHNSFIRGDASASPITSLKLSQITVADSISVPYLIEDYNGGTQYREVSLTDSHTGLNGALGTGFSNIVPAGLRLMDSPFEAANVLSGNNYNGTNLTDALHLHSPNSSSNALSIYNDTYSTANKIFSISPNNSGVMFMGTDSNTNLNLYTNGSSNPRLTILAGGSIGINTITPSSTYSLDVNGIIAGRVGIYGNNPATNTIYSGSGSGAQFIAVNGYWALREATDLSYNLDTYNGGTPLTAISVSQTGSVSMAHLATATGTPNSICQNGSVITVNAALTCTVSSRDYKTKISRMSLTTPTAMLMKLQPVQFAYRDHTNRMRWGFIAEDVAKVDRKLADGYDAGGVARSLDQNALLALAIKTIQEQEKRIEALEAKLK